MFNYHYESNAIVRSPVNQAFAYIDDPTRLSSHMSESSWKMGGGRMEVVLDEGRGQKVGSQIRLVGRVFGIELSVIDAGLDEMCFHPAQSDQFTRRLPPPLHRRH